MKGKQIAIELSVDEIKKEKEYLYSTDIEPSWFKDCCSEFYKIISAYGDFKFTANSSSILMSGKFIFSAKHICSRCACEFEEETTEEISQTCDSDSSGVIDIFPILRELVIINEPIKILCPSCKQKK